MPVGTGAALPFSWGTTLANTSVQVLPYNPARTGLMFINQGAVAVAVCPAIVVVGLLGVYAGPAAGVATINGAGSITMQPGDKFIIDTIQCTAAWNGIAAGAGVLTILES